MVLCHMPYTVDNIILGTKIFARENKNIDKKTSRRKFMAVEKSNEISRLRSTVVCWLSSKPVRLWEDFTSQSLDFELFEFLELIFQISPTYSIFYKNRSPTVRHSAINSLHSLWPEPLDIRVSAVQ